MEEEHPLELERIRELAAESPGKTEAGETAPDEDPRDAPR